MIGLAQCRLCRPANCAYCACPNTQSRIFLLLIFRALLYANSFLACSVHPILTPEVGDWTLPIAMVQRLPALFSLWLKQCRNIGSASQVTAKRDASHPFDCTLDQITNRRQTFLRNGRSNNYSGIEACFQTQFIYNSTANFSKKLSRHI